MYNFHTIIKSVLYVLMFVAVAAVFLVLLVGLIGMLRNKEFNKKYGNVMMRAIRKMPAGFRYSRRRSPRF